MLQIDSCWFSHANYIFSSVPRLLLRWLVLCWLRSCATLKWPPPRFCFVNLLLIYWGALTRNADGTAQAFFVGQDALSLGRWLFKSYCPTLCHIFPPQEGDKIPASIMTVYFLISFSGTRKKKNVLLSVKIWREKILKMKKNWKLKSSDSGGTLRKYTMS